MFAFCNKSRTHCARMTQNARARLFFLLIIMRALLYIHLKFKTYKLISSTLRFYVNINVSL